MCQRLSATLTNVTSQRVRSFYRVRTPDERIPHATARRCTCQGVQLDLKRKVVLFVRRGRRISQVVMAVLVVCCCELVSLVGVDAVASVVLVVNPPSKHNDNSCNNGSQPPPGDQLFMFTSSTLHFPLAVCLSCVLQPVYPPVCLSGPIDSPFALDSSLVVWLKQVRKVNPIFFNTAR